MYLTTIEESIRDILITPLGSRVMLPEYGSKLFELVDRKVDDEFRAKLTLYVVEAVEKWEHRVKVQSVKIKQSSEHKLYLKIFVEDGNSIEVGI